MPWVIHRLVIRCQVGVIKAETIDLFLITVVGVMSPVNHGVQFHGLIAGNRVVEAMHTKCVARRKQLET